MFTKTPASTKGKYYVYTLSHPEDGMVSSIDKGAVKARKSLRERIDNHKVEAQQGNKPRHEGLQIPAVTLTDRIRTL